MLITVLENQIRIKKAKHQPVEVTVEIEKLIIYSNYDDFDDKKLKRLLINPGLFCNVT